MVQVFKRYKLPKFIQEKIENLGNPMPIKEVEFVVKNFPKDIIRKL